MALTQIFTGAVQHAVHQRLYQLVASRTPMATITGYDTVPFWELSWPERIREAVRSLREFSGRKDDAQFQSTPRADVPIRLPDGRVFVMYLHDSSGDMLSLWHMEPIPFERLGFYGEKAAKFIEWMEQEDQFNRKWCETKVVTDKLLEIASTPAQLVRMLPDLLQMMPSEERSRVGSSWERARFPYEWASYDRIRVKHAANTIALCGLINKVEPEPYHKWNNSNVRTQAPYEMECSAIQLINWEPEHNQPSPFFPRRDMLHVLA